MTYMMSRSANQHFWPDFTVFIVSDLNDLTFMYTKIFLCYSYTVTVNPYLGNTYNEIFKYYYTEHYYSIVFLFVMRNVLGQKNTIVSGLRARHFKTSASMLFL